MNTTAFNFVYNDLINLVLFELRVFHLRLREKKLLLRQKISSSGKFVKIRNLMGFHISKFFILTLRMNISYYVCGKPTALYECEYLLFRR
jgi:hypothetical protein